VVEWFVMRYNLAHLVTEKFQHRENFT
jgi:hypothetical protein